MSRVDCRMPLGMALLALVGLALGPSVAAQANERQDPALPQVLSLVPEDATIVVVVPNLEQVSRKLALLENELDLGAPPMADALGSLRDQLGARGLDERGSAALVLSKLPIPEPGQQMVDGEPEVLLLVPVTDYDAMVAGFNAAEVDGGVHRFRVADSDPIYARRIGGHAVLGPAPGPVADHQGSEQAARRLIAAAGEGAADTVRRSDVSMLVNVAEIGPRLRPILEQVRDEQLMMMQMMMGGDNQMVAANTAIMQMTFKAMDLALRDTRGAVLGLEVGGAGAMMSLSVAFREGSDIARHVRAGQGAPRLMARLPNRPFLFTMAGDSRAVDLAGLMDLLAADLGDELKDNVMLQGMTGGLDMARLSKATSSVTFAPRGGLMGLMAGFEGVNIYEVEDTDRFVQAHREGIEQMAEVEMDMGMGPEAALRFRSRYQQNAATVNGVQVHRFSVEMQMPPAAMGELGPMAAILQGMGGQQGFVAARGDHVVVTSGQNVNLVREALQALEADRGLGSDGVIPRIRRIVGIENPAAEGYVDIKPLAEIVGAMLPMMGGPQIRVPADLQPLAMSAATRDGEITTRFFVPMSIGRFVRDMVDVFEQLQEAPPPMPQNGAPRPPAF